jgi:hypothetical protein
VINTARKNSSTYLCNISLLYNISKFFTWDIAAFLVHISIYCIRACPRLSRVHYHQLAMHTLMLSLKSYYVPFSTYLWYSYKGKAIPVTGCGGP